MKSRKVLFALVLSLVLCLSVSVAMAAAFVETLNAGTSITLASDTTAVGAISTSASHNITVDLGGHVLSFSGNDNLHYIRGNVTFKNGTIDVSNAKSTFALRGGKVTFEEVELIGDGFSGCVSKSWNDLFDIGSGTTVTFKDSTISLTDMSSNGAIFRMAKNESSHTANYLIMEDTVMTLDNTKRGIITQYENNYLEITNSAVTMQNMKHGINLSGPATLDNSTLIMSDLTGHGIGLYKGPGDSGSKTQLKITNGSTVSALGCDEGDIAYEGLPVSSNVTVDDSSAFAIKSVTSDETGSVVKMDAQEVVEWLGEQTINNNDIYADNNGNIIVTAPVPVVPTTPSSPSVPRTGDNSQIALWILLMAISAVSFVALSRKSRFN